MNPHLDELLPYPFERLAALKQGEAVQTRAPHISLAIGEPKHPTPALITDALCAAAPQGLGRYPATRGQPELRAGIARWLENRYRLTGLDPERQVLPVNGTREALFAFAQTVVQGGAAAKVLMPNPGYQIYEGAALLAGARPYYLACGPQNGYLPDLDAVPEAVWDDCQLIYLCSPGNPTGAVLPAEQYRRLLELADRHDFVIASDECYSELYSDEQAPPPGLLQVCAELGRHDYARCVVFHSLSKRSSAPGLRSGFVAGDAELLRAFLLYRTYHGGAMAEHVQQASIAAWADEAHVAENRRLYREKFAAVDRILRGVLDYRLPEAGFYLWPRTPIADTDFALGLYREQNVTVLPGSFLSREAHGSVPGANHVRIALVADYEECVAAAERLRAYVNSL
ncbi:succinyldiaminopimelate transaminase [Alkalilimnicola sp. S0819]|uniref:succinyldiaminopimelate transaminase n=1 Tax=Alkalilimnicola sp. S0819 TaxID=2613922 RepID=UPI001262146A|nr:succinyldiaminopimelate transaminase [Alkalilimnicola sp. S0819]KAB7627913.1 succinyldiaminopimelate transaminase [Alkalilimnicola sp. S0819]MPQ15549.1 succinyldiaminopimelate transaminase [Alkalilimnicola sp. S0819]